MSLVNVARSVFLSMSVMVAAYRIYLEKSSSIFDISMINGYQMIFRPFTVCNA